MTTDRTPRNRHDPFLSLARARRPRVAPLILLPASRSAFSRLWLLDARANTGALARIPDTRPRLYLTLDEPKDHIS